MLSAALIAAVRFVSAVLYVVNIFSRGHHATTYLGGFDVSPASVAEEHDVYESV
jgi:hypothetical protein